MDCMLRIRLRGCTLSSTSGPSTAPTFLKRFLQRWATSTAILPDWPEPSLTARIPIALTVALIPSPTYASSPTAAPCQASVAAESSVALPPVPAELVMQYYAPSVPAVECLPLVPDNTPTLVCPSCGDTMKHLRTIPKLGARLEQFIFVCPTCEDVDTKGR